MIHLGLCTDLWITWEQSNALLSINAVHTHQKKEKRKKGRSKKKKKVYSQPKCQILHVMEQRLIKSVTFLFQLSILINSYCPYPLTSLQFARPIETKINSLLDLWSWIPRHVRFYILEVNTPSPFNCINFFFIVQTNRQWSPCENKEKALTRTDGNIISPVQLEFKHLPVQVGVKGQVVVVVAVLLGVWVPVIRGMLTTWCKSWVAATYKRAKITLAMLQLPHHSIQVLRLRNIHCSCKRFNTFSYQIHFQWING